MIKTRRKRATSTLEKLGKMTGSDKENNKSTYVTLLGIEKCEELVKKLELEMKILSARCSLPDTADKVKINELILQARSLL